MMIEKVGICCEYPEGQVKANILSERLGWPIVKNATLKLLVESVGLSLVLHPFLPVSPCFQKVAYQKRGLAFKQQGLLKAIRPQRGMTVIDATAGWGQDATLLAACGASVLMLEQNPIMAVLLEDALADKDENLALSFQESDAVLFLKTLQPEAFPDVIYLDPMHPERKKSAHVKKEMRLLQHFIEVPSSQSLVEFLKLAMLRVKQKVVLKWPIGQPSLVKPSYVVYEKTIRFDVYSPKCL